MKATKWYDSIEDEMDELWRRMDREEERRAMKPSEKTEGMEQSIKEMFGHDRRELIEAGCCVPPPIGCDREGIESEFRNEISRREYSISGLCQKCQDNVFGED